VLRALLALLMSAALAAVSLLVLAAAASAGRWDDLIEWLAGSRGGVALLGGIGLGLAAAYWLSAWPARRRRFVVVSREGGRVSIGARAIADQVRKLAEEFPPILRMRPHVWARGDAVNLRIDVAVVEGTDINELAEGLRNRVRQRLAATLGLADVERVDVDVRQVHAG
jgi:hypothetical protein